MTTLKHDNQGFLVGDLITAQQDMLDAQHVGLGVWRQIRTDVRSIARILGARSPNSQPAQPAGRGSTAVAASTASPRGTTGRIQARDAATGRFVAATRAATPRTSARAQRSDPTARTTVAEEGANVALAERDGRGRFKGKGKGAGAGAGGEGGGDGSPGGGGDGDGKGGRGFGARLMDGLGGLKTAIEGVAHGAEQVDPAVTALNEVKDVVAPIGRGLFSMFGRNSERKKERWYQRILNALKPKAGVAAAAETAGEGGGGIMGGIGRAASGILPMIGSILMRVFAPIAGIWASFEIGQWIGTQVYKWLDESGLLTKVFDVFDTVKDFVSDTFNKVADSVSSTWKTVTDGFAKGVEFISSIPQKVGDLLAAIDAGIRKVPIIGDLYAKAAGTVKTVTADAQKGYEEGRHPVEVNVPGKGVVQQAAAPAQSLTQQVGRAAGAVVRGAANAKDWVLGKTSEQFESGGRGAGAISSGKGDRGGASYGTYQLASKTGDLQKFLDSSGYGDQFKGLKPGTPEFNAQWQKTARDDPAFGDKQHKYIEDTHFTPQMDMLKKNGIDLSDRGAAVKDAVWSTSVQFGGKSSLITKALAGKDASKMSDTEVVNAIQDYKAANNDKLFASSSDNVRAGTAKRAEAERASLLALAGDGGGAVAAGGAVTAGTTVAGGMPTPPQVSVPAAAPDKVPAPPEVSMPTMTADKGGGRSVAVLKEPIGQDVGDRKIAHIVSGGISA